MFDSLSEKLEKAFKTLRGQGKLTEDNVRESVKDVRRALLDADVNFKVVKQFIAGVEEKAYGQETLRSVAPGEQIVKIIYDELVGILGGQNAPIEFRGTPGKILLCGLQGSGKTTFCGKLAKYLKEQRKMNPLLVACDVYRPAAIDQLTVLGESIKVAIYKEIDNKNPVDIARNAVAYAKANSHNVIIVDTAGRLAVDEVMMDEVENIKKALQPTETLFVVDAMTGQDAVNTAEAFNTRINFDGVVLTKLDGDTRGGAALSIKYTVGKPIKFASQGEKLEALDVFYPDRMAQRILGMGDIVSLVEKAQMDFDEDEAKRLEKRMKQNKFDFNDSLSQMQTIKKMGDLKSLMAMIPGVNKALKDAPIDENALVRVEAIIQSMTPQERANPELMSLSRKKRLARGCGQSLEQINLFIRNFEQMRKMMHQFANMPAGKMGMPPGMGMPKGGFR